MPRKTKTAAADRAALPLIPAEFLEKLIPGRRRHGSWKIVPSKACTYWRQRQTGIEASPRCSAQPAGGFGRR